MPKHLVIIRKLLKSLSVHVQGELSSFDRPIHVRIIGRLLLNSTQEHWVCDRVVYVWLILLSGLNQVYVNLWRFII